MKKIIDILDNFIKNNNSKINCIDIKKIKKISDETTKKSFFFIDGGNQHLISDDNFCIDYIKICSIKNNKLYKTRKFYTISTLNKKDNKIIYNISTENKTSIHINAIENNLRIDSKTILDKARKFFEVNHAINISNNNKDSIIVLDGIDLNKNNILLKKLKESIKKNKNILLSLTKNCNIIDDNTNLLAPIINKITDHKTWIYKYKNNDNISTNIIKLHKNSNFYFKLQFFNNNTNIDPILSKLKEFSKDPVFLGYPYPLIKADEIARVSNHEKNIQKNKLISKIKNNQELIKQIKISNAHEILDNIKF